jgi:hypothetical protein
MKTEQRRRRLAWAFVVAVAWVGSLAHAANPTPMQIGLDVNGDGVHERIVLPDRPESRWTGLRRIAVHDGVTGQELSSFAVGDQSDAFGWAAAVVPDVDGDGVADLLVAAPLARHTADRAIGAVRIVSWNGRWIGSLLGETDEQFGVAVSAVQDVDGDGRPDWLVRSRWVDESGDQRERDWVFRGGHATVHSVQPRHAARVVGVAGDVNADDVVDMSDFQAMLDAMASGTDLAFDLTGDGLVDTDDLAVVLANAGRSRPQRNDGMDFGPGLIFWSDAFAEIPTPSGDLLVATPGGGPLPDKTGLWNEGPGGGGPGGGGGGTGGGNGSFEAPRVDACGLEVFSGKTYLWQPNDGTPLIYTICPLQWQPQGYTVTYSIAGNVSRRTMPNGCVELTIPRETTSVVITIRVERGPPLPPCISEHRLTLLISTLDVDVDSDNDNGYESPERDVEEERIEDVAGNDLEPGKVVLVNSRDEDGDGIPEYADGTSPWHGAAFESGAGRLTPLDLELRLRGPAEPPGGPFVRLRYPESAPWMVRPWHGPDLFEMPARPSPATGTMRVWLSHDSSRPSHAGDHGHYLAPGIYRFNNDEGRQIDGRWWWQDPRHGRQMPGWQDGSVVRLWVEVLQTSVTTGDVALEIDVDLDGDGPLPWRTERVRFTSVRADLEARGWEETAADYTQFGGLIPTHRLPESSGWMPSTYAVYRWTIQDPRGTTAQRYVTLNGLILPLTGAPGLWRTPEFYWRGEDLGAPSYWLPGQSGAGQGLMPWEWNPQGDVRAKTPISKIEEHRYKIVNFLDDAIRPLVNVWNGQGYAPTDNGAFGSKAHAELTAILDRPENRADGWYANVWIRKSDRAILQIGGDALPGYPSTEVQQADVLKFRRGTQLVIGQPIPEDRLQAVYEVKLAARIGDRDGRVVEAIERQLRNLRTATGKEPILVGNPSYWKRGVGWIPHPYWHTAARCVQFMKPTGRKVASLGRSPGVSGASIVLSAIALTQFESQTSAMQADVAVLIDRIERAPTCEERALCVAEAISVIGQYLAAYTPGDSANIVTVLTIYKVLGECDR